jgi:hypothetical protein
MFKRLIIFTTFFLMQVTSASADTVESVPETNLDADNSIEYKLSLSDYSTQNVHSNDINLRVDRDNQRGWIGYYKESSTGFDQLRGGYERNDQLLMLNVDSSLQVATHGFIGGSVTATTVDPFFGMIGYGVTNLKPYANLNFDPNDAITLGVGYKKKDGPSITLFMVRDVRVMPGQQNLHLLMQFPFQNKQRITLDVFNKSGPTDPGQSINGVGASLTYDWPSYFLRIAYDPKVNFTQDDMTRITIGMRF